MCPAPLAFLIDLVLVDVLLSNICKIKEVYRLIWRWSILTIYILYINLLALVLPCFSLPVHVSGQVFAFTSPPRLSISPS